MGTSITQSIAPIARQLAGEERNVIGRIKDVSADVDNLKQPTPPTQPPPPKQPEQEPFLGFGSAATGLMVLASAFTRAPLVNALNAATAGMNAARAKKTTDFQNAYAEWKQQVDYAMKLHTYEQDAYKNAIDKAKVSIDGAKAEATVLAHSFKDQAAVALLERGDWTGFRSLVGGRGKLGTSLQSSTADLKTQVQQMQTLGYVVKAIKGDDPKAAAAGVRAWSAYLVADERGKGDTAGERKKTTDDAMRFESLAQDLESGDPERVKSAQAEALRMLGSQVAAQKGEPANAGRSALTEDALNNAADTYNLLGKMPTGRWTTADRDAIMNRAAARLKEDGGNVQTAMQTAATNSALEKSLNFLERQRDAITGYERGTEKELNLVESLLPGVPEPIDSQLINRWARTGATQFGDVETPKYFAALVSGLDEYAKVLSGGYGAAGSTDSSRAQAAALIPPGATTEQVRGILGVLKEGMERKRAGYDEQINEITSKIGRPIGGTPKSDAPAMGAPAAGAAKPMPASKEALVSGQVYQTARGPARWNGTEFERAH